MTFNKLCEFGTVICTSPESALPDYFLTFLNDCDLGNMDEFDLDGMMSSVPGVPLFRPDYYPIDTIVVGINRNRTSSQVEHEEEGQKTNQTTVEENKEDLFGQIFYVPSEVGVQGSNPFSWGGEQGYLPPRFLPRLHAHHPPPQPLHLLKIIEWTTAQFTP